MTVTATPWSVKVGSVVSRGEARFTAIEHTVTGHCWRPWRYVVTEQRGWLVTRFY